METSDRDQATEGDLRHAGDSRPDRACADISSDQQHDHGGKRRDAEARIDRRRERQRSDRKRENESLRGRGGVGNEHAERRSVNRAAERADHVFDGRPKRSPDAPLRDDNGRQHRPQTVQRKAESLDEGESGEGGDRHTQTEAQVSSVSAGPTVNHAPDGQAIHAKSMPNNCCVNSIVIATSAQASGRSPWMERAIRFPYTQAAFRGTNGCMTSPFPYPGLFRNFGCWRPEPTVAE